MCIFIYVCVHIRTYIDNSTKTIVYELKIFLAKDRKGNSLAPGTRTQGRTEDIPVCIPCSVEFSRSMQDLVIYLSQMAQRVRNESLEILCQHVY